jgi:GT2 family glycosyltransferase
MDQFMAELGVVAIGRNEGERLRLCLESVVGHAQAVVYVDSGSSDGSVELARSLGVEVVELDTSRPFTAAWARNEGMARLLQILPSIEFVQFVDGDCEVVGGWIETASRVLEGEPVVGVVCGRRRERFPERSVYNRMADLEWDSPIGPAKACGGDAAFRVEAFRQVGGYNPSLIAGEEPDLCVRLRKTGWTILRIDAEMTLHDMAMTRFGQWWKRAVRAGHAFTEGAAMHGAPPERHWVRETRSISLWGLVVPLLAFGLAWPTGGISLLLLATYPMLFLKTYRYYLARRGWPAKDAGLFAFFVIVAKFPQAVGQMIYLRRRLVGGHLTLIEYKGTEPPVRDPCKTAPATDPGVRN